MGSKRQEWISPKSAAKQVGLDAENIIHLAEEGFIRKLTDGNRLYIHKSDLDRLRELQKAAEVDPEELARRVMILESMVKNLTESINLVHQVNGMASSRFESLDDGDLMMLYENIKSESEDDEWPIARLLSCCEVFLRIGELEIERLNDILEIDDAWKAFYELCLEQSRYVVEHDEFDHDLELQRCRDLLAQGRSNLRSLAVLFIELSNRDEPSHKLISAMAASDIDMFDTLAAQLKNKSSRADLDLL